MADNFNPGFDREKKAFIDLANRGEGLTPINYLFADEANFESVLASYVKGGTFDIGMMYVINIDAKTILTNIIDADIAYIDIAYMRQLHINEIFVDYVLVTEAYVEKKFGVGVTNGKDWPSDQNPQARFYTNQFIVDGSSFNSSAASFDLESSFSVHSETTTMTSDALTSLAAGGIFNISSGLATTIDAGGAIVLAAGAYITMNTFGNVTINPNAAFTPCGSVTIYSQNSVEMSAPELRFGNTDVTMGLAITNTILMKSTRSIDVASTYFIAEVIEDIRFKAWQVIELSAHDMNFDATADIQLNALHNIEIYADNIKIQSYKDIEIYTGNNLNIKPVNDMIINAGHNIEIYTGNNLNIKPVNDMIINVGHKLHIHSSEDMRLESNNNISIYTDKNTFIYSPTGDFNIKAFSLDSETAFLHAGQDMNIKSSDVMTIASQNLLTIKGYNRVKIDTNDLLLFTSKRDINLYAEQSIEWTSKKIELTAEYFHVDMQEGMGKIEARFLEFDVGTGTTFDGSDVLIKNSLTVGDTLKFGQTTFTTSIPGAFSWSTSFPELTFITGVGNLASDTGPVIGQISFTIPNVMTCENGVVSVKNITVSLLIE